MIRLALFCTLTVWSFQNCSVDNFATHGNGTPYEGISIDPPPQDPGDTDPDAGAGTGTDNQNSDGGPDSGNRPQPDSNIIQLDQSCVFNNSEYLLSLVMGINSNNEYVLVVSLRSGNKVTYRVAHDFRQHPMDYQDSSGIHVDLVIRGTDSASVTYTTTVGQIATELTSCQGD